MESANALELRPGETDFFYFIFSDMLATGDELTGTPTVDATGITVSAIAINTQPLTLGGVEYPANTVVQFTAADIAADDLVECDCLVSTTTGRTLRSSIWIEAIKNYAD